MPCRPIILAAALLALASAAAAQSPPSAPTAALAATQASGLFISSCLRHASNAPALRDWARQLNLRQAPARVADGFLHGTPGVVYDASNPTGRYVILSHDDGSCAVLTKESDGPAMTAGLESALSRAGVVAILALERTDPDVPGTRHRIYNAAGAGRSWTIILTATPEQTLLSATAR
jgi:hypothetical protein